MLSSERFIGSVIDRYPAELRDRIRVDIEELLNRDRHFLLSQVQYLLSQYHCCSTLLGLRTDIDAIFLGWEGYVSSEEPLLSATGSSH